MPKPTAQSARAKPSPFPLPLQPERTRAPSTPPGATRSPGTSASGASTTPPTIALSALPGCVPQHVGARRCWSGRIVTRFSSQLVPAGRVSDAVRHLQLLPHLRREHADGLLVDAHDVLLLGLLWQLVPVDHLDRSVYRRVLLPPGRSLGHLPRWLVLPVDECGSDDVPVSCPKSRHLPMGTPPLFLRRIFCLYACQLRALRLPFMKCGKLLPFDRPLEPHRMPVSWSLRLRWRGAGGACACEPASAPPSLLPAGWEATVPQPAPRRRRLASR